MSLLKMSLSAGIIILVIVVIRGVLLHKLPKKTFLILWGVALCRLLIPFSIPSKFSIFTILNLLKNRYCEAELPMAEMPIASNNTVVTETIPTLPEAVSIYISPTLAIWLIGLLTCTLFFLITHLRCRKEYRTALPIDNEFVNLWQGENSTRRNVQIRQSDMISAPLTYGIFRPVILLPKQTDWSDENRLRYILMHEFVHIRRFDILTKLLLVTAFCVHWFNPFVWLMYMLANRDIELSCDETVVRIFGREMKSAYAMTLIGLEEKKSRLSPLVNNFSKNAIEERIVAIMKTKRPSLIGIILAFALVIGTATVFATGALANDKDSTNSSVSISGTLDGKNYIYSDDGGNTWISEAEYKEKNPDILDKIEFWEIDEFEKWMEQEKIMYQEMAEDGTQKFYDSEMNKWRIWTQQDVDKLYSMWQEQLLRMKQGYKYTKDIELSDGAILAGAFEPDVDTVAYTSAIEENSQTASNPTRQELLAEYNPYGITFDKNGDMYFQNKLVRYFYDGVDLGDNAAAVRYEYLNEKGTVDVHTTRIATDNGDGSIDPFGELTGIKKYSQAEFEQRNLADLKGTSEAVTYVSEDISEGETFKQKFSKYQRYGIEYKEQKNSGVGNVYYNGQLVKTFIDENKDGGVFSFQSVDGGEIVVHTVYNKEGKLIGVEKQ